MNDQPRIKPYRSPFCVDYDDRVPPIMEKERMAFTLSGSIRAKDDWEVKMTKPTIVVRWKK